MHHGIPFVDFQHPDPFTRILVKAYVYLCWGVWSREQKWEMGEAIQGKWVNKRWFSHWLLFWEQGAPFHGRAQEAIWDVSQDHLSKENIYLLSPISYWSEFCPGGVNSSSLSGCKCNLTSSTSPPQQRTPEEETKGRRLDLRQVLTGIFVGSWSGPVAVAGIKEK